jgi:YceI-like domain
MHAKFLRERHNVLAALQSLHRLPAELVRIPSHSLLCHLQFPFPAQCAFSECLIFGVQSSLPIDTEHSVITVHVFKSGLFSAFADNHEIRAPISSGLLDEAARRVEIVVDSRKLVVLDPNLPPEKRQQVQERMLGPEVLDSNQFHEIRFQANDVKEESADHFLLAGTLSLHGKTRPISLHVVRSSGHYRGDVMLKQRDFAITPVTVAGGTVKVKDIATHERQSDPMTNANTVHSIRPIITLVVRTLAPTQTFRSARRA